MLKTLTYFVAEHSWSEVRQTDKTSSCPQGYEMVWFRGGVSDSFRNISGKYRW